MLRILQSSRKKRKYVENDSQVGRVLRKLMEGGLTMQWVRLEGSLQDKVKIEALEAQLAVLNACVLEMSELVYA